MEENIENCDFKNPLVPLNIADHFCALLDVLEPCSRDVHEWLGGCSEVAQEFFDQLGHLRYLEHLEHCF